MGLGGRGHGKGEWQRGRQAEGTHTQNGGKGRIQGRVGTRKGIQVGIKGGRVVGVGKGSRATGTIQTRNHTRKYRQWWWEGQVGRQGKKLEEGGGRQAWQVVQRVVVGRKNPEPQGKGGRAREINYTEQTQKASAGRNMSKGRKVVC